MQYDPQTIQDLRNHADLLSVVGRRVPLKRKGREHSACCPFHNEKTPSFSVHPDKGFYHCFGCQAHGDIIDFVMKFDSLNFVEALKRIAQEEGFSLPEPKPENIAAFNQQQHLLKLMQAAADFFSAQLQRTANHAVREYLQQRGLQPETVQAFQLGYAPDSWDVLKNHLTQQGFSESDQLLTGMLIANEEKKRCYDRFRHRLMFPIADAQGQIVAFGGRSLDGSEPKYLNSPDSPLFHKGNMLYNLHRAGKEAHKTPYIVVEGYMDVISLAQAGFHTAVAPMGTALTDAQLQLVWRKCDTPILCFDGDKAGQRAALRGIERALPLLKAGKTLNFITLPAQEDPDSLIRKHGATAFARLRDNPQPLIDCLLEQFKPESTATPEKNAQSLSELTRRAQTIVDPDLRTFYQQTLRERFYAGMRNQRHDKRQGQKQPFQRGKDRRNTGVGFAQSATNTSYISRLAPPSLHSRESKNLLLAVINHPDLADDFLEPLGNITFPDAGLERLRLALLRTLSGDHAWTPESLVEQLRDELQPVLQSLQAGSEFHYCAYASLSADKDTVRQGWRIAWQQLTQHLHAIQDYGNNASVVMDMNRYLLREKESQMHHLAIDFSDS